MFSIALQATDNVQNKKKQIQKAYFCLALSRTEKTRLENGSTDPRGFAAAETGFWRGKTS
jgi:hypothetical protein